jgi:hypothetical protein
MFTDTPKHTKKLTPKLEALLTLSPSAQKLPSDFGLDGLSLIGGVLV